MSSDPDTDDFYDPNTFDLKRFMLLLSDKYDDTRWNGEIQFQSNIPSGLLPIETERIRLINCNFNVQIRCRSVLQAFYQTQGQMDLLTEPGINQYHTLPTTWNGSTYDFTHQIGLRNYIYTSMVYQICRSRQLYTQDVHDLILDFLLVSQETFALNTLQEKPFIHITIHEGLRYTVDWRYYISNISGWTIHWEIDLN